MRSLRQCLLAAARAAVAAGQGATVRTYAARLLWQLEPTADDAYASAWYRRRVLPVHVRRALLGEAAEPNEETR